MTREYQIGDYVTVIETSNPYFSETGVINRLHSNTHTQEVFRCYIKFDNLEAIWFYPEEIQQASFLAYSRKTFPIVYE